jgi:hypothetical protein
MTYPGRAAQFWTKWPVLLLLLALPAEARQDALEPVRATTHHHPITRSPAVAARNGQNRPMPNAASPSRPAGVVRTPVLQPIMSLEEQGALFRARKRAATDSARVLHRDRPERPFREQLDEPEWLRAELAPPRLSCEPEPPAPEPRRYYWRLD